VSLSSAATLLGGVVPLAVGFLAQRFGLSWALASLAAAPVGLLAGLWRPPPAQTVVAARQSPEGGAS
jgi:hypothetical protein